MLATLAFAGCADVMMAVISPIQNMRVSVNNTMPYPVNQVATHGTRVDIFNPQPYYAMILNGVQRGDACVIPPGGSAFDDHWSMNFSPKHLSLVAILYRDAACTEWVGMSMTPLDVYSGQSSSWVISQVWYPDNAYRYNYGYGVPTYPLTQAGGVQRITLMGPPAVGMNYVTIPNCTYYKIVVRRDGAVADTVQPGGVFRWSDLHMYAGTAFHFDISFLDQNNMFYGYKDLGNITMTSPGSLYQYMATTQDASRAY
jgi:hypothetical protein